MMAYAPFGALLEEVIAPHREFGVEIEIEIVMTGPGGEPHGTESLKEPNIWRHPEIIHGLGNLVENAVDFARTKVIAEARWDSDVLVVIFRDDGPGFAPEIMAELGEPYVSTRRAEDTDENLEEDVDPDETIGMGLGFFIAKNLLERTGATLDVRNVLPHGAEITVTWPRGRVEIPEDKGAPKLSK